MFETMRAYGAHVFTATGAVFAMLALLAAVDARWAAMFLWLVVAFIVDGVDGALARRYDVTTKAPIIDGALLDLVIDYLTYVFVPAFALHRAGLLPGRTGLIALLVIVVFATRPELWRILAIVIVLTAAMFVPVKFVHPVRTRRWRALSLPVAVAWTGLAGWAALTDFSQSPWATRALVATSTYLLVVGAVQQVVERREARATAASVAVLR
jgi:phosphatidylcholine synthase